LIAPGKRWLLCFTGENVFDAFQSLFIVAMLLNITFFIEHPEDRFDRNDKAGCCDEAGYQHRDSFDNPGLPGRRISPG
jgi:hypothetical protein